MAALAADLHLQHRGNPKVIELEAAGADVFYVGAVAVRDTNGRIQVAGHGAGDRFAGIVTKRATVTAAGQLVEVAQGGIWRLPITGAAQADEESVIYIDISAASDNPADLLVEGSGSLESGVDVAMGTGVKYISSGVLEVDIEKLAKPSLAA